jgi:hypothetical protein
MTRRASFDKYVSKTTNLTKKFKKMIPQPDFRGSKPPEVRGQTLRWSKSPFKDRHSPPKTLPQIIDKLFLKISLALQSTDMPYFRHDSARRGRGGRQEVEPQVHCGPVS